jgi:hypothetical protein
MKYLSFYLLPLLLLFSCDNDESTLVENQTIIDQLTNDYELMPEALISQSVDSRVYAQYVSPTDKYTHGVLGDRIEAEGLVVVVDGVFYELELDEDRVFEDIRPRLYDVTGDGELEFVTIRTNIETGAGIAIYKIINDRLVLYASVTEIGSFSRWLNIVVIDDLDNDGIVELVWVETPHIGGILKVAKIHFGLLRVLDEEEQYSNHGLGERNLCMSVLTDQSNQKVFYVPNQSRNKIVGFSFEDNNFTLFEEIDLDVDFSETLISQYEFTNPLADEVNCIEGK